MSWDTSSKYCRQLSHCSRCADRFAFRDSSSSPRTDQAMSLRFGLQGFMTFCLWLAGVKMPAQDFHCPKSLQGMEQPGLDGSNGAAERRSDTVEGIVDVKPQVDDLLMLWGEDLDTFLHEQCPFAKFHSLVGQELGICDVALWLNFHACRINLDRQWHPAFVSKNIAEAVKQDCAKPGEELAFAMVARQATPGFEESFLS